MGATNEVGSRQAAVQGGANVQPIDRKAFLQAFEQVCGGRRIIPLQPLRQFLQPCHTAFGVHFPPSSQHTFNSILLILGQVIDDVPQLYGPGTAVPAAGCRLPKTALMAVRSAFAPSITNSRFCFALIPRTYPYGRRCIGETEAPRFP
jgi:hypothetical protein